MASRFWENKSLPEMDKAEWESLCDGCGYCCLVKLEDEDDGHVYTTNVACKLLDTSTCRCQDYDNRQKLVSACMVLSADKPEQFELLPETCAYRRKYEARVIPDWHPLLTSDRNSVKLAGVSVCEFAYNEEYIHPDQLQEHIIHRLK